MTKPTQAGSKMTLEEATKVALAAWEEDVKNLTAATMRIALQAHDDTDYGKSVIKLIMAEATRRGWTVKYDGFAYTAEESI